MPEQEHQLVYIVVIKNYGNLEVVKPQADKALARALFNSFGDKSVLVLSPGGDQMRFDHLADDGHHEGHDPSKALVWENAGYVRGFTGEENGVKWSMTFGRIENGPA